MTIKKRRKKITGKKRGKSPGFAFKIIKGDKARRYRNTKTGKIISRRQADKLRRLKNSIKPRAKSRHVSIELQKFYTVVGIYISSHDPDMTKRQAIGEMRDYSAKGAWRDLHDDNPQVRKSAWEFITGGVKDEWVPYIERWRAHEL